MKSNYLILTLVALATACTIFELAANDPDPRQHVRIIDLPPVTEAALLTSGIDRQTLSEYLELKPSAPMGSTPSAASTLSTPVLALETDQEVKPAPGRIRTATTKISSLQTREKRDGHSLSLIHI